MAQLVRLTAAAAGTDTAISPVQGALFTLLGLVLLAIGISHYRGYRSWVALPQNVEQRRFVTQYTVLAMAWLGGGLLLCLASVPLPSAFGAVTLVAGILLALVGVVGLVWLPRSLRPRWLLEMQNDSTLTDRRKERP